MSNPTNRAGYGLGECLYSITDRPQHGSQAFADRIQDLAEGPCIARQ